MPAVQHVVGADGLKAVCEQGKPVVAKFFATWCGSCKQVAPKFEKFAEENAADVTFVEIDYDESESLCQLFNVDLLPSFIAFKGPKKVDFAKGSDEEGIKRVIAAAKGVASTEAAEQQSEPAKEAEKKEDGAEEAKKEAEAKPPVSASSCPHIEHVVGFDGLKEVCERGKPVVAKFYATWCGSCKQVAPKFEKFAEENAADVTFVQLDYDESENVCQAFNVDLLPSFMAFKGPKKLDFAKGSDEEGIKRVIAAAKEAGKQE